MPATDFWALLLSVYLPSRSICVLYWLLCLQGATFLYEDVIRPLLMSLADTCKDIPVLEPLVRDFTPAAGRVHAKSAPASSQGQVREGGVPGCAGRRHWGTGAMCTLGSVGAYRLQAFATRWACSAGWREAGRRGSCTAATSTLHAAA